MAVVCLLGYRPHIWWLNLHCQQCRTPFKSLSYTYTEGLIFTFSSIKEVRSFWIQCHQVFTELNARLICERQASSVSTVTRLLTDSTTRVWFLRDRDFSICHIQTGKRAYPASNPLSTEGLFLRRLSGLSINWSHVHLINHVYNYTPPYIFMKLYLIKQRDSFPFI